MYVYLYVYSYLYIEIPYLYESHCLQIRTVRESYKVSMYDSLTVPLTVPYNIDSLVTL